jgi:hypothetical protein
MIRDARKRGLKAPVLLMGYYNPLLSYGEERMLQDAKEAGANGFIMVDLPPEEALRFRNFCRSYGSVSSRSRCKLQDEIADNFSVSPTSLLSHLLPRNTVCASFARLPIPSSTSYRAWESLVHLEQ